MTTNTQVLPDRLLPLPTLYKQAAVTVLLAGWADWLFFGHNIGITFAVFIVVLAGAIALLNQAQVEWGQLVKAGGVLVLSLLPSLESLGYLSASFGVIGVISFVLMIHRQLQKSAISVLSNIGAFVVRLPARLPLDTHKIHKVTKRSRATGKQRLSLSVWAVPIGFSLIFLVLFANANPLIEKWLTGIDLSRLTDSLNGYRVMFWFVALLLCWPFIRFKPMRKLVGLPAIPDTRPVDPEATRLDLFGEPAIFRSLLLFNLLFGLQIALDATYLLGGADLPDGMTYAQYAHRGAYPLICTALLAAAFVLFATRPGAEAANSARVRTLILAWTAQNVILVMFSIQRLSLYVEAYALTYWRFAAAIWMVLVLIGLVLIVAKFLRARSNEWLVEMNLIALLAVLYVTSFVNVASVIANYNVSRSAGHHKPWLDASYLQELGTAALPSIDRAVANHASLKLYPRGSSITALQALVFARNRLAAAVSRNKKDWRMWSFRRHRLQRYLDTAGLRRVPNGSSSNER